MRKYSGLLVALILLALPAFANAGQLTVKVVGGVIGSNYVALTGGAVKSSITSGTNYYYPTTATTITVNGAGATMTAETGLTPVVAIGSAVATGTQFTFSGTGNATITVTYTAASNNGVVTINQSTGGTIYVQLPNGTFTSALTTISLPVGTILPVTVSPDSNNKVASTQGMATSLVSNVAGQPVSGSVTVPATISAVYSFVGKNTVSLKVAGGGFSGQKMIVSATSTSNDSAAKIAFAVSGVATGSQLATLTNGGPVSFSFTPSTTGTATVTATATSANDATGVSTSADITISSAAAAANNICLGCHNSSTPAIVADFNSTGHENSNRLAADVKSCQTCHSDSPHDPGASCIGCHSVGQNAGAGFVQDNKVGLNFGVRSITQEFAKWSHHVTGVTLDNAHCAACHLEGKAQNGAIVVDPTYHMADAQTHLRNAHTDADMQWDPANPTHSTMDNFCMSCHSATGATSPMSVQIQALINANGIAAAGKTASALNPFGDTISNRYDKMQRPAVVNVDSQFNTTNNSHHGVKGKRYTGRTRVAGSRQILAPTTFANNSSATLQGARSTIYDAGNFNALYSPLGTDGTAATGLGDDSTLHCGDCHTVGQWKVGSSDTANGSSTPAAIGAHGSNNEYLLRNTLGTDERHTQNAFTLSAANVVTYTNPTGAFLVCYNCHSYTKYGSIYVGTGLDGNGTGTNGQPHAGEYDQQGRCNGIGNTIPFNGYTTGAATDGTQFASRFMLNPTVVNGLPAYAGEQNPDFGNVFGIQCANCHNSGAGNAYGGIHGSANNQNTATQTVAPSVTGGAYIDGMGNTTKIMRFLPGLGNAMHVPGTLGGISGGTQATFLRYSANANRSAATALPVRNNTTSTNVGSYNYTTGGISSDTNWEQKAWNQVLGTTFNSTTGVVGGPTATAQGAGCYTLGSTATASPATINAADSSTSHKAWWVAFASAVQPPARDAATTAINPLSQNGGTSAPAELLDNWGGCEDHGAAQGGGDHGFVKRIVRPVTY